MEDPYNRISQLENVGFQNNLLSYVNNKFEYMIRPLIPEYKNIVLTTNKSSPTAIDNFKIYFIDDFFDDHVIQQLESFIEQISPHVWAWPLMNLYEWKSTTTEEVLARLMTLQYGNVSLQWRREKYRKWIRFAPCSLADYIYSPLFDIINVITDRVRQFAVEIGINDELYLDTCVLQEIVNGNCMGIHQDINEFDKKRRLGFIYYLRAQENCGGELCYHPDQHSSPSTIINIKPNQLIIMDMSVNPWHSVNTYNGETSRISLVGFLSIQS